MSVCSPCYNAGILIGDCSTGVSFSVVNVEETFQVYIQNNATGRAEKYTATSDALGNLLVEGITIDAGLSYTIWGTNNNANDPRTPITIGDATYDCITFVVAKVPSNDTIVYLTEQA